MVPQAIILITCLIPSQQIQKNDGEFEIISQDIPFVELDENESSISEFRRVMSKDEWLHLSGYLKAVTQETIIDADDRTTRDPSVFCRTLRTCSACVAKRRRCNWCHDSGCGDRKICRNNRRACPSIAHEGKLLIPAGVKFNILLRLNSPDPDLLRKRLLCVVRKEERVTYLPAHYSNSHVMCNMFVFDTNVYGEVDHGSLRVMWGGFQEFSNKVNLLVYRCHTIASDCPSCSILPPEYGCGWCQQLNYCTTASQCQPGSTEWSTRDLACLSDECETCWTSLGSL